MTDGEAFEILSEQHRGGIRNHEIYTHSCGIFPHCDDDTMLQDYFEKHAKEFGVRVKCYLTKDIDKIVEKKKAKKVSNSDYLRYFFINNENVCRCYDRKTVRWYEYEKEFDEYLNPTNGEIREVLRPIDYVHRYNDMFDTKRHAAVFWVYRWHIIYEFLEDDEKTCFEFVKEQIKSTQEIWGMFEEVDEGVLKFSDELYMQYKIVEVEDKYKKSRRR